MAGGGEDRSAVVGGLGQLDDDAGRVLGKSRGAVGLEQGDHRSQHYSHASCATFPPRPLRIHLLDFVKKQGRAGESSVSNFLQLWLTGLNIRYHLLCIINIRIIGERMKNLLAVVSMMMLVGCTSVAYNGGGNVVDRVSYPKVGEVVTAQVGDHLVEKGSLVKEGVLKVNQRVDGFLYDIPAQAYRQVGADSENDFYGSVGVTRNPLADPVQALAVAKEDDAQVPCVST